jgi:pimeloyl-ACP methyl ester carboxylesterase
MRILCVVLVFGALTSAAFSQLDPVTHEPTNNPVRMVLSNPKHRPECRFSCGDRNAIVFVHGLWGSEKTWMNADHKTWPVLLSEDPFFDGFDVFLASYPTSEGFWSAGNKVRLTDVSRGLYDDIVNDLLYSKYKTINLIGHSMGGNIILTSVLFLKFSDPDAHAVLGKYNIVLLGTPVDGQEIANLATLLSSDEKLIALKPATENELPVLTELAFASIQGKRLAMGLDPVPIAAAYETKPFQFGPFQAPTVIVSQASATALGPSLVASKGFDRDHSTLVKPKDQSDLVYVWVREQILRKLANER